MKSIIIFFILFFVLLFQPASAADSPPKLDLPLFLITSIESKIGLEAADAETKVFRLSSAGRIPCSIQESGDRKQVVTTFDRTDESLLVVSGGKEYPFSVRLIPGYLSLLPPLIAIFLAFVTKDVIISLFIGIFIGSFFVYNLNPLTAFFRVTDTYVLNALCDRDRLSIIVFSMVLGGMIGIVSNSGGARGIVNFMSRFVDNCRSGQISSWLMGIVIFFDDYANTLLVGNTMRPLSDKLRISREKLSYIVDSTAAPVASLFVISTWIGYEIGQIAEALKLITIQNVLVNEYQNMNTIAIFVRTIPFSFYALFTLFFVGIVAISLRDFGPMYHAEKRARRKGKPLSDDAKPISNLDQLMDSRKENLMTALIPIASLIAIVIGGLWYSGTQSILASGGQKALAKAGISDILGSSSSLNVLIWASFMSTLIAIMVTVMFRALSMKECVEAWVSGVRSMILAMVILVLSWCLSAVCKDLYTSQYVGELAKTHISYTYFPLMIFGLSGFIAFCTGTSWGTMGILFPIAIPVAFQLVSNVPDAYSHNVILGTIAAVLSGASFGDHCSPISDTTIMSSMATGCDHMDHVKTQIPYAFLCGTVAGVMGFGLIGLGVSPYISLFLGCSLLAAILGILGKRTDEKAIMDEILDDLNSNDPNVKEEAVYDLGTFKTDESAHRLVTHFLTSETENVEKLSKLVIELGPSAYSHVVSHLGRPDCRTLDAIRMINEIVKQNKELDLKKDILEKKLSALMNSNPDTEDIQIKIMVLAGKLGLLGLLPDVIELLESENSRIKATAVLTIGMLGSGELFSRIKVIIAESSGRIRANAIESLMYFTDIDRKQIKELVSAYISDENYRIRSVSKRVLYKVSEDKEIIESYWADYNQAKSLNEKLSVIYALGEISTITGIRMLLKFLESEIDPVCTQKIIEILRKKGQTSILPFINEFLTRNCKGSESDAGQL